MSDRGLDVNSDQRETLQDIQEDYRTRFSNFFENEMPEQTYHDVEETLATPPPVVEQLPNTEQQQRENSNWYAGGFRNVAKRVWSFFNQ